MTHIEILQRFLDSEDWAITDILQDDGKVFATLDHTFVQHSYIQMHIDPSGHAVLYSYRSGFNEDTKIERSDTVVTLMESLGLDNFTVRLVS